MTTLAINPAAIAPAWRAVQRALAIKIGAIHNEAEYDSAVSFMNTPPDASPHQVLRFLMDHQSLKQTDLAAEIGGESRWRFDTDDPQKLASQADLSCRP